MVDIGEPCTWYNIYIRIHIKNTIIIYHQGCKLCKHIILFRVRDLRIDFPNREWSFRCCITSLAGRYRSHAPERCIFLNNIFGSPKGSIYQIFMFPARNIFSMVFLAAILAAILDFQRPSWICINQHNFKTNYHRETNDTNFSWYFDTTNPFAMLFLGFGQHFLGNGCHGDKNIANFEKCLYTFSSWKCTIYKYMLYGHYMSHIICLIYFVIILDVDKAPTNAVGLHYHGNHYLKHLIKIS